MPKKKVVIVGGGFGGVCCAQTLARLTGKELDIELINSTNYFVFQPLLPEVAAGVISASDAVVPLRAMLDNVQIRQAEVIGIDLANRRIDFVQGAGRYDNQISYDHLVLAIGQQVAVERIPGVGDHGFVMKDLTDAFKVRNHVLSCLELADVTSRPELKQRYLTFAVVGGGFSGVETIGEVEALVRRSLKLYPNIAAAEVRFILAEFGSRILTELPEHLAQYAQRNLESRGIEVRLNTALTSVSSGFVEFSDKAVVPCSTVIATVGNRARDLLSNLPLPLVGGKIEVDRHLRVVGQDAVWALGDATRIPLDDSGHSFAPPTAQFAVREGRLLARNIAATLNGMPTLPFLYKSKGAMASLGVQKGVANVMGIRLTGFPAWLVWRAYYLSLLPGFAAKLRVFTNWLLDAVISRNTVQTQNDKPRGARIAHFRRGEVLFSNGMHYDGLYILLDGKVSITIEGVRREIKPGEYFGERTMLAGIRARGISLIEEDSRILILSRKDFFALHDALPLFQREFISTDAVRSSQ